MTIEQLKEFVTSTFKIGAIEETDTSILFNYHEIKIELNKAEIIQKINDLNTTFNKDETELFNNQYYEILTRDTSRIFISREREQAIIDEVNGLTYFHGKASDYYVLNVIDKIINEVGETPARRYFDPLRFRRMKNMRRDDTGEQELFPIPVLDFVKEGLVRFETITIKSTKPINKAQFEQYSYSYIFSLSYNLSYTIYPLRFFDEFFSPLRIGRIRRNTIESIEPPKRTYVNDLILHYQKALSSESLDHQFLSFYHVIEHFFEKIYNEDLLQKVKSELTKPGFSYKKKNDIEGLIKIVQNRTKIQREEFQVNELEALELTLRKYITDTNELKTEINEIESSIIDYYKTNDVPFSKGPKVNFDLTPDEIYRSLAKRIYFTRNSIVHSKETEKQKYTPFKDDKDLINEIYLMRIITEKVILNNSREI
jgi:hypothetical protein